MSDDAALEGALVPAPQPAEMRYEDKDADKVTRVLVVVERADGSVREYEAREPQDFRISDPEQVSTMAFRLTGLSIGHTGFRGLQAAVPTLSLSFSAHPRYNLHIRNGRKDAQSSSAPSAAIEGNVV